MRRLASFAVVLVAAVASPAIAHADPISAAVAATLTTVGVSAATATAIATFTVNTFITAAGSATKAKFFGRRAEP